MSGTLLNTGDELSVTVTAVKPFGVFVTADSGTNGLVRGAQAVVGDSLRVRVLEYDAEQSRFSAVLA